ncbi:Endonuclease TnsA /resolvase Hjc/tRNA endonuclease [Lasiodiplodia theobromae]|uniref:Required for respiratory growth protein 7, mitochondrial n=1 Tax=Lasiodiplodia theobromae TaxID=45133 RepID=A0A5N5DL14_9PEZI|nr:DNA mismatch repair protein [Lasiodiplodia theobromae]KAB2578031.1 Uncharacterized protein DBV05_g3392 [Lasiodiplodia theobromae]KAF4538000.1 DNA mismatch repair protein [Lasiodiplodia theobromae]KAF9638459.1 Endonuclease TnsA /resolvase Hjc/tRNA endonuclease [Lasiodiplodia theobromae]
MRPLLLRSFKPPLLRPIFTPVRAASRKKYVPDEPTIAPGSENHHDLPSFLAYAERVELAPDRTVYVGTHYEYTVAATLKRFGFRLTRTGRASDFGIDLLGTWTLPISDGHTKKKRKDADAHALRVLVQCKASNKILNPKNVRELEGAFTGAPALWREEDFLGLLATTQKATKGVMEALGRSRWPMGFLKVDPDGRVEQFLWNASAKARGLEGLGVTLRYLVDEKSEDGEIKVDIALTWQGRPLPYVELEEEAEALPTLQMRSAELEEMVSEPVSEPVKERPKKKRSAKLEEENVSEPEPVSEHMEEKPKRKRIAKRKEEKAFEPEPEPVSENIEEKPEKKKRGRPRKKREEEEA